MSANNLCTPYYEPSSRITGRATVAVTGKRFVALTAKKDLGSRELDTGATGGNIKIGPAAANDVRVFGVAETDAAVGKTTTVLRGKFTLPITAGVALAYGDLICVGALGKAVKPAAAERVLGMSLSDAAVDQDAIIALF